MAKRRTLSKRTRFEVFKRDRFRCQYCGKEAPAVVLVPREIALDTGEEHLHTDGLHVDHVIPLAVGGDDDITNYVTACVNCNLGKGAIPLDDDAAVRKQRAQMEDVAARREQIEMMAQWQRDLAALDASAVDVATSLWASLVPGTTLAPAGKDIVAKALRRFGPEAVLEAMRIAVNTYGRRDADGTWDQEALDVVLDKLSGICFNRRKQETLPELQQLYYIRGILKNRFPDRWEATEIIRLLERAVRAGMAVDTLAEHARSTASYWRWKNEIEADIEVWEGSDTGDVPAAAPTARPALATSLTHTVVEWARARWGAAVRAEDVRLRTERNGYTTTRPLWIAWSLRHAVTFEHWCAVMDMAEAAERMEEMMLGVPVPPYPAITPADLSAATLQALDRVVKAAMAKYGPLDGTEDIARDAGTALMYGFHADDLIRAVEENATIIGWLVEVDQSTTLAMRLRAPADPFAGESRDGGTT
jgi:5-methylcytosine-specific restriction endonuclease McrA